MAVQLHNSFGFQLSLCAYWEEQSWNLLNAPSGSTDSDKYTLLFRWSICCCSRHRGSQLLGQQEQSIVQTQRGKLHRSHWDSCRLWCTAECRYTAAHIKTRQTCQPSATILCARRKVILSTLLVVFFRHLYIYGSVRGHAKIAKKL